jgi:phospholipid/cholesterol/gamma-HCH transport system substrate-binding protein
VDLLAQRMRPAFESLRPPFLRLDEANAALRPFAQSATPVIRDEIRPFTRALPPFQRDFGAASRELAGAAPDMTTSFRGLNRLFDIGAYNPGGTEGISEGCQLQGDCSVDERARNEGYLYWLGWLGQNTTSLFSTSDALGPIRRAYLLGLNCDILKAEAEPLGIPGAEIDALVGLLGGLGACAS